MTTDTELPTTTIVFNVVALRHRILAVEADINALTTTRTNADTIQHTEATYQGLIANQDCYRRHVRQQSRRLVEVAQ
jgi:hypothetical protein